MTDELTRAHEAIDELREAMFEEREDHLARAEDAHAALDAAVQAARREGKELEALFDLQHSRMVKWDKEWLAAHPDRPLTRLDLVALIDWLRAESDRLGFLRALSRVEELMAGSRETGVSIADVLEDLRKESHGR